MTSNTHRKNTIVQNFNLLQISLPCRTLQAKLLSGHFVLSNKSPDQTHKLYNINVKAIHICVLTKTKTKKTKVCLKKFPILLILEF